MWGLASIRPLDVDDRVTKIFVQRWALFGYSFVEVQNLQVKSLILAQIERWRRA